MKKKRFLFFLFDFQMLVSPSYFFPLITKTTFNTAQNAENEPFPNRRNHIILPGLLPRTSLDPSKRMTYCHLLCLTFCTCCCVWGCFRPA